MYELAILLFGGLVAAKSVDFLRHLVKEINSAGTLLVTFLVGVGYAYLFNFSLFAGWGVAVRTEWIGTLATGLFMAGMAGAWHEALGVMREWAHRYHGEATEIEARMRKAA